MCESCLAVVDSGNPSISGPSQVVNKFRSFVNKNQMTCLFSLDKVCCSYSEFRRSGQIRKHA